MIDAELFLANLRNSSSAPMLFHRFDARDFPELPPSIVQALNRKWAIAPVLAHSTSASVRRSMGCLPTPDPSRLVTIALENPDCNWAVETGNGLLILEVNTEVGLYALRTLSRNSWEWRETLRFRSGQTHFFAFQHSGRGVRFLGNRFQGVKLHWNGSAVLLPPSWFVLGQPVAYVSDPAAELLDAPAWLLDGRASLPQ